MRPRQRAGEVKVGAAEGPHRPVGAAAEDRVLGQRQRLGRARLHGGTTENNTPLNAHTHTTLTGEDSAHSGVLANMEVGEGLRRRIH